ncbi:MAG: molybdopterin-guanine dinucleotide biosynthesis protein B [Candidatus Thorarchaeota archaeon]
MRVFCISGYSNSGKTTLLTKVVGALSKRGYRVATVKNSKENIVPPEGSDTFRHLDAGAVTSVLLGPSSSTVRYTHRINLESLKHIDADFLLIEGMKESDIPKIWCTGGEAKDKERIAPETVAIVSWKKDTDFNPEQSSIPVLVQSDIEKIIEIVEKFSIDI